MVYLLNLTSECIFLCLPPQKTDKPVNKRVYFLAVLQSYGSSAYTLIVFFKPSIFSIENRVTDAKIAIFTCIPLGGAGLRAARAIAVAVPAIKTIVLAADLWMPVTDLVIKFKNLAIGLCQWKRARATTVSVIPLSHYEGQLTIG